MYDNVFISSFGSNLYNTIGFLESMKERTSDAVIWNSVGNASLILFLRIMGFQFHQMTQQLKDLNLSHTFINGFSLIPENEEEKKEYILYHNYCLLTTVNRCWVHNFLCTVIFCR